MPVLDRPQPEPWDTNPHGRKSQLNSHLTRTRQTISMILAEMVETNSKIPQLEALNRVQVDQAGEIAYSALEDVVFVLLDVSNGHRALSREDERIVSKLEDSISKFHILSEISRENMKELGKCAGDVEEVKSSCGNLADQLWDMAKHCNIEGSSAWSAKDQYWVAADHARDRQSHCEDEVRKKQDAFKDLGNGFLSLFDDGVERRLNNELNSARENLRANLQEQQDKRSMFWIYYEVALANKNAEAAFLSYRTQVLDFAAQFPPEFGRITEAQSVEQQLWSGLLDLQNKVFNSEYVSTRNKSLHQVLELLQADDAVFMRKENYERTERRIRDMIQARLGEGSVDALIAGTFENEGQGAGELDNY